MDINKIHALAQGKVKGPRTFDEITEKDVPECIVELAKAVMSLNNKVKDLERRARGGSLA